MKREDRLLIDLLYENEPHVGAGDSFADRFRICRGCLVPLDVWLHMPRQNQAHVVAEVTQSPSPVVSTSAGLDTDPGRRQTGQRLEQTVSVHATSKHDPTFAIDAVNPEYTHCDIASDRVDGNGAPSLKWTAIFAQLG